MTKLSGALIFLLKQKILAIDLLVDLAQLAFLAGLAARHGGAGALVREFVHIEVDARVGAREHHLAETLSDGRPIRLHHRCAGGAVLPRTVANLKVQLGPAHTGGAFVEVAVGRITVYRARSPR